MYIVFDTETTGLPEKTSFNLFYHPKLISKYDSSRVVQLAWNGYDCDSGKLEFSRNFLIKPFGFTIENESFHNISQEKAISEGLYFNEVIQLFIKDVKNATYIVGHNIMFDLCVLRSECYRYKFTSYANQLNKIPKYCTMTNGRNILKMFKFPSLQELHLYFFKNSFKNMHNAIFDVEATAKCYQALLEKKEK